MDEQPKKEKSIVKGSKRAIYAAKVRNIIPYHLGRSTRTISNTYAKQIGINHKISLD